MVRSRVAPLIVFALCSLTVGCKFWQTPAASKTPAPAGTPKLAFVANFNSGANGSVRGYLVDGSNGSLSSTGAALIKQDAPTTIAAHPNGKFVYVANQNGNISVNSVDREEGALEFVASTSFADGHMPSWLGVTPDGKFLYALMTDARKIHAYSINSSTGSLTPLSSLALDGAPARAAIAASGHAMYVALGAVGIQILNIGDDGNVSTFKTISPSPCSEITAIVLDKKARWVFAANGAGGGVCNYTVNPSTGDLTLISSTLNQGGAGADAIAINPSATVLLTANSLSNNVTAYVVAASGILSPLTGSPLAAGQAPSDVVVDALGTYVYVVNSMENTISLFKIKSDKTLQWGGNWTTEHNPQAITVIP